jgi:hypothetical protein
MRPVALCIAALIVVASAITVAVPESRVAFERSLMTPGGLDVIAALRIAVGLIFILAAAASRAPWVVRAFGVLVIIAGLATAWFGADRASRLLDWASRTGPMVVRADAAIGLALGMLLIYVLRRPPARV